MYRPPLAELLDDHVHTRGASGLIEALAALGAQPGADATWIPEAVRAVDPAAIRATWAARLTDPAAPGFLVDVESLALAARALAGHGGPPAIVALLTELVGAAESRVGEVPALSDVAPELDARLAALGPLAPWPRVADELRKRVDTRRVQAWLAGRTARAESDRLRELCTQDGPVRDAYRAALHARTAVVRPARAGGDWAAAAGDPPGTAARVPLPHLGTAAALIVRERGGALEWIEPGADTRPASATMAWGDAVTGPLSTIVTPFDVPNPAMRALVVRALRRWGEDDQSDVRVPLAAAREFLPPGGRFFLALRDVAERIVPGSGLAMALPEAPVRLAAEGPVFHLHAELLRAPEAVVRTSAWDALVDEESLAAAACLALEARLRLGEIAATTGSLDLATALDEADEACALAGPGLLLIDDEEYEALRAEFPPSGDAWYGAREALDQAMPDGWVEDAIARRFGPSPAPGEPPATPARKW